MWRVTNIDLAILNTDAVAAFELARWNLLLCVQDTKYFLTHLNSVWGKLSLLFFVYPPPPSSFPIANILKRNCHCQLGGSQNILFWRAQQGLLTCKHGLAKTYNWQILYNNYKRIIEEKKVVGFFCLFLDTRYK